ncbi:MAG: hypothetical protein ACR2HM_07200 [Acidimicrobiales bacterium]
MRTAVGELYIPAELDPENHIAHGVTPAQVVANLAAHPEVRAVLADTVGRISAEMAATYPPGIPVVVPGERLAPALVAHLAAQVAAGGRIDGPQDPKLGRIQVVCE